MRTEKWLRPTPKPVGDGEGESGYAYANSGLRRVDSITSPTTQNRQLSESLSDLESQVQDLTYKYLEVCATLLTVMSRLAKLSASINDTTTTEEDVIE